jgi:hypothetical protein
MLALLSVWIAVGALVTSIVLILYRSGPREEVLTLLPYTVAFSATLAAAVLWACRKRPAAERGVAGQRLQGIAALVINSVTFAVLLLWLHGVWYGLLGLALEGAFLCCVYWLYTRVLVPD